MKLVPTILLWPLIFSALFLFLCLSFPFVNSFHLCRVHVLPSHFLWAVSKRPRRDRAATSPSPLSCSEGYVLGAPTPCNTRSPVYVGQWPTSSGHWGLPRLLRRKVHTVLFWVMTPCNLVIHFPSHHLLQFPTLLPFCNLPSQEGQMGGHFCLGSPRKSVACRMDDARISKASSAIPYLSCFRLALLNWKENHFWSIILISGALAF
jgi:hypothetical protein